MHFQLKINDTVLNLYKRYSEKNHIRIKEGNILKSVLIKTLKNTVLSKNLNEFPPSNRAVNSNAAITKEFYFLPVDFSTPGILQDATGVKPTHALTTLYGCAFIKTSSLNLTTPPPTLGFTAMCKRWTTLCNKFEITCNWVCTGCSTVEIKRFCM